MTPRTFLVPGPATRRPRDEGLARYVRLEYGDGDLSWTWRVVKVPGRQGECTDSSPVKPRGLRAFASKVASLLLL